MKYTKGSVHALLASIHGLGSSSKFADSTVTLRNAIARRPGLKGIFHEHRYPFAFKDSIYAKPDVGILIPTRITGIPAASKRRLQFIETCPTTCSNAEFCSCMTDYDNTNARGQETCASIIATSCENPDEMTACIDDPYYLAMGNYFYCPLFQCFNSSGIGMHSNETKDYFECFCYAESNMCEECKKLENSVPYCKYFMSNYRDLCSDVTSCCVTETSMEGLASCHELWCDCSDVSTTTSTSLTPTEPAQNRTVPNEVPETSDHTNSARADGTLNAAISFQEWGPTGGAENVLGL
eukprot:CCRYP_001138-RA/>CCRYP_001138-RA protein AED:0.43 eAED:1.00 QI:0/0/0/1/0/0/2/0/294